MSPCYAGTPGPVLRAPTRCTLTSAQDGRLGQCLQLQNVHSDGRPVPATLWLGGSLPPTRGVSAFSRPLLGPFLSFLRLSQILPLSGRLFLNLLEPPPLSPVASSRSLLSRLLCHPLPSLQLPQPLLPSFSVSFTVFIEVGGGGVMFSCLHTHTCAVSLHLAISLSLSPQPPEAPGKT